MFMGPTAYGFGCVPATFLSIQMMPEFPPPFNQKNLIKMDLEREISLSTLESKGTNTAYPILKYTVRQNNFPFWEQWVGKGEQN